MKIEHIKRNNLEFIAEMIYYNEYNIIDKSTVLTPRVVIKLKNKSTNESRIHTYTQFLDEWKNCKLNTILNNAKAIVPFLNYLTFQLSVSELKSVHYLTFEIIAEYLNTLSLTKRRSTIKQYLRTITRFCYFMYNKNLLYNVSIEDFKKTRNDYGTGIISCPKLEMLIKFPKENKRIKLKRLENEVILSFILTALKYTPSIALGVYFQIFGGMRYSEVLNIIYPSIKLIGVNGRNGMNINLKTRHLRTDIKDYAGVKKPRLQNVIAVGDLLEMMFRNHKKNYSSDKTQAVFVDSNGNAMSTSTYRNQFNKLKRHFIQELKNSDDVKLQIYALTLLEVDWSTHISRGIFSNIVSENASNATQIALKRGDSSLDSVLVYLTNSKDVDEKIQVVMGNFYSKNLKEQYSKILQK